MSQPLKKRARAVPDHRLVFQLVLPYLFPGRYQSYTVAFRTFLALAGTCRNLRYWNVLRRWIGYVTPYRVRQEMIDHSFPAFLGFTGLEEFQEKANKILCREKIISVFSAASFVSFWVMSGFFAVDFPEKKTEMEITLGNIPLFNMAECKIDIMGKTHMRHEKILMHHSESFSEFALFCFAACTTEVPPDVVGFLAIVNWKTEKYDHIYIEVADRERFAQRTLVGRMKRIGLTAPQEIGFQKGQLPCTAYSWFVQHCDTNGTRKKVSPLERLEFWVNSWFPMSNRLWGEKDKANAPYEFHFEVGEDI